MTPAFTIERHDRADGRFYSTPTGTFPSVTTILAQTRPGATTQRIAAATAKRGRAEAMARGSATTRDAGQIWAEAARSRGSDVHNRIEEALTDPFWPAGLFDAGDGWWQSAVKALAVVSEPMLVEAGVASPRHGFAGTVDAVARCSGGIVLADWKSAGSPRRREWVEDYELQLGAYAVALRETYGVEVDRALVAVIYDGPDPDLFWLDRDRLAWAWARFRIRLASFAANRPCMPVGVSGIVGA